MWIGEIHQFSGGAPPASSGCKVGHLLPLSGVRWVLSISRWGFAAFRLGPRLQKDMGLSAVFKSRPFTWLGTDPAFAGAGARLLLPSASSAAAVLATAGEGPQWASLG
jgi:hypothetical protein